MPKILGHTSKFLDMVQNGCIAECCHSYRYQCDYIEYM